jgi:hemolysin activation/secretion protein
MNGTLQVRASPNQNVVTQAPFDSFDISGESQLYEVSYRQPLLRSIQQEFALSLGFGYQVSQTFLGGKGFTFSKGPDSKGVSRTSVLKFGQDYTRRDNKGVWSLRSQFNFGVDLFDATVNSNPTPDGRFFSWLGQVQRLQVVNDDNFLILSSDIQLTPDNLLPSQQFIIGGGQSLRGYRQNARLGDNGVRFSIEDRITLLRNSPGASSLQIAPFADLGVVWDGANNPNPIIGQKFLAGAGLGVLWVPVTNLNLRLDYGVPLIDTKIQNRNLQDSGFYFSVNYQLF